MSSTRQISSILAVLLVAVAGILCVVIFTTGCVQRQSDVDMAVESNDHAACAYVAKERGWYKDEGINFTAYESYATGMRLASALARGDIQVAYICLSPAILAYSRGVPIKIVAGTHKYGYGLVVSPGITNISDLEGKTIGCVLRREIRQLQRNAGITTVFDTHNLTDAEEMGDRVVVLNNGKIWLMPPEMFENRRIMEIVPIKIVCIVR